MPSVDDATIVLTPALLQTPTPANGCLGIMGFTVSGVAFVNINMRVWVEIKTDAIFYNSNSASYIRHWNYWDIDLGISTPLGTAAYEKVGSSMFVYTGAVLDDPISPSDVGLDDLDFLSPIPYPSTGYNTTFTQLQTPDTILVTATLYGQSTGAFPGDPYIYTETTSYEVAFSSSGCSSASTGSTTLPLWTHDGVVTCGWVADPDETCGWVADATLPCTVTEVTEITYWDFSMTSLVDFSQTTEAATFDSTMTGADN